MRRPPLFDRITLLLSEAERPAAAALLAAAAASGAATPGEILIEGDFWSIPRSLHWFYPLPLGELLAAISRPADALVADFESERERHSWVLEGDSLLWSHQPAGHWEIERFVTPAPLAWATFWTALARDQVWGWGVNTCSRGCLDRESWTLELIHLHNRLNATGDGPGSAAFAALRALTQG